MHGFKEFIRLDEVQIQFNKNRNTQFGNVVILAGGAGSGKGFTVSKLIGIQGKTFDVDALKEMFTKRERLVSLIKEKYGFDLSKFDLRSPTDTSSVHEILANQIKLPSKREKTTFTAIATLAKDRKPNLIFDVTLRDISKLYKIAEMVTQMGYEKENIHLVWVLNDIEIAKTQNLKRDRVVSDDILVNTHAGASQTMRDVINNLSSIGQTLDGDIFITFNQAGVDTQVEKSKSGGSYVKKASYFHVKEAGKAIKEDATISKEIVAKIKSYVPNPEIWDDLKRP